MNLLFKQIPKSFAYVTLMSGLAYNYKANCTAPYLSFISHGELQQLRLKYPGVHVLDRNQSEHILSVIRNANTGIGDYRLFSDRLIRLLLEKAVSEHEKKLQPQQNAEGTFQATELAFEHHEFCVVTILRSGSAFLPEAFKVLPGASVGSLLVQNNAETDQPELNYSKLPKDIGTKQVILVDAMLSTGQRAATALKALIHHGVKEENITILNIIASEKGITTLLHQFPKIKVVTATVDYCNDAHRLQPGIGDFSDRYFGTL